MYPKAGAMFMAAILAAAAGAEAGIVTVDPDAFPDGTEISTAYPGVLLQQVSFDQSIYSISDPRASTGDRVFAPETWWPYWFSGHSAPRVFEATFFELTNFVSIDVIAYNTESVADIVIYNDLGGVLDSFTTTPGALLETVSFTRLDSDIRRVMAWNPEPPWGIFFLLDNLKYDTAVVPEPSAYVLFLLGLAPLALARLCRRRSRLLPAETAGWPDQPDLYAIIRAARSHTGTSQGLSVGEPRLSSVLTVRILSGDKCDGGIDPPASRCSPCNRRILAPKRWEVGVGV